MWKYASVLVALLLLSCSKPDYRITHGTLTCGNCGRVVYSGDMRYYPNGFFEPVGKINHCKQDDPLCKK